MILDSTTRRDLGVASLALVAWELALHVHIDCNRFRDRGSYRKPAVVAYFVQRYGALVAILTDFAVQQLSPPSCQAANLVSLLAGSCVLAAVAFVLSARVKALYHDKGRFPLAINVLWTLNLGASFTAPAARSARNSLSGGCTFTRAERWADVSLASNAAFIFVMLAMAALRRWQPMERKGQTESLRFGHLLPFDGMPFFLLAALVSIVDAVLLPSLSASLAWAVLPLHFALLSIATTRLANSNYNPALHPPSWPVAKVVTTRSIAQSQGSVSSLLPLTVTDAVDDALTDRRKVRFRSRSFTEGEVIIPAAHNTSTSSLPRPRPASRLPRHPPPSRSRESSRKLSLARPQPSLNDPTSHYSLGGWDADGNPVYPIPVDDPLVVIGFARQRGRS